MLQRRVIAKSGKSKVGSGSLWPARTACPPVLALAASCQWHPQIKVNHYPKVEFTFEAGIVSLRHLVNKAAMPFLHRTTPPHRQSRGFLYPKTGLSAGLMK